MKQKVYAGFDVLKLILAVFMVATYTHPFDGCGSEVLQKLETYLFSMAVPFFFAIVGFLLFRKRELRFSAGCGKNYIFRMIKLYVVWNMIYLPVSIYGSRGMGFADAVRKYVKEFFFVGEHYLSWPLWYLLAVIYGLAVIYLLIKCRTPSWGILIIGIGLYRFSDVLTYWIKARDTLHGWRGVIADISAGTLQTGRIFTSVLFLSIGLVIARTALLHKIPVRMRAVLAIAVLALYLYHPEGYVYMIGRPLMVFLWVWFLSGIKVEKKLVYERVRNAGTVMYFTHMLWYFLYVLLSGTDSPYGYVPFIFCIAGGALISEIQMLWKRREAVRVFA